jgi:hypothetical protein
LVGELNRIIKTVRHNNSNKIIGVEWPDTDFFVQLEDYAELDSTDRDRKVRMQFLLHLGTNFSLEFVHAVDGQANKLALNDQQIQLLLQKMNPMDKSGGKDASSSYKVTNDEVVALSGATVFSFAKKARLSTGTLLLAMAGEVDWDQVR